MPGFELFGDEERRQVQDVLDTGVLFRYGFDAARRGHWKAREFELSLADRLGVRHCHLCSSGTSALDIALSICGVGAGDEVIVPPFTFVATIEAVMRLGAVPVFADIDETLCLDPAAVERAVTERTRAVLVVHMCGAMARIDALDRLCHERDIALIEDTAQAIGASFNGRALGTFGRAGCFSFDPVKTITCGEGGAVVTDDDVLYALAHQYADHGHDHEGDDRGLEGHPVVGTNYRISELNAAVGLAQLAKLDLILDTQRRNKQAIRKAFAQSPDISFRNLPDPAGDSATFLSILAPDKTAARKLAKELKKAGAGASFYWYDNNWHYIRKWDHIRGLKTPGRSPLTLLDPVPNLQDLDLGQSDDIMSRTVSMLVSLSWTPVQLEDLTAKISSVLGV